MTIRVEIVSQDRLVYKGDADMVTLPGIEGEMGVLPGHTPLLTTMAYGVISVKAAEDHAFTVAGGIVEVQPEVITILADAAEDVNEINIDRAQAAKRRAEEMLKQTPVQDTDEYLTIEAALRRSNLRIEAASRFRQTKPSHRTKDHD
jgi:F-type H+-transporting ATPase subunit epsilon